MAGILWFAAGALADVAAIDPTREAFVLALLVGLGLVAFGAGALCFGAARIADIKRLLDRSPG
jgi:hypothetical protein